MDYRGDSGEHRIDYNSQTSAFSLNKDSNTLERKVLDPVHNFIVFGADM